ncbi:MAG: T9SS type A sorting domain-containing protein, partial [Bacteroidales bacterium]|nr:T9SS type A sorting domain-containing protein [Bacteroidales bacterium]
ILPTNPVLTVTAASNGTKGEDNVITFNGMAKFNMSVTGLDEDDDLANYTINADIYGEDFFAPEFTREYETTETVAEFDGVYNGEYYVEFYLPRISGKMPEMLAPTDDNKIDIKVTNYEAPAEPEFAVKAVGGVMAHDTVVFANGNAAFDMFVEGVAATDTTYALYVTVWNMADEDAFPEPDILKFADSVRFENTYYNGVYEATFELRQRNRRGEYSNVTEQKVIFSVTEGETRPELTVKPVGNTMAHDTVVFANGNVAFDMLVKGLNVAEGDDSTFKFHVTVYTEDEEDYRLPQEFTYADSVRFVDVYYNGVYEAVFELMRRTPRGTYTNVTDQKFIFMVTENEEPVENYELTVKAVGATMSGDTAWFTGKVAFDMFAGGYAEGDTLAVTIYTPAQFEDTLFIKPNMFVAAADSVRFETTLDKGTVYVAVFELLHKDSKRGENVTVKDVVMHIALGNVANEAAELAGVNVYPNPNAGTFNVTVPERALVEIFGLNGAKVMSREVNAGVEAFNINHSGIYFVRVMAGNKTAVKRVVVR